MPQQMGGRALPVPVDLPSHDDVTERAKFLWQTRVLDENRAESLDGVLLIDLCRVAFAAEAEDALVPYAHSAGLTGVQQVNQE